MIKQIFLVDIVSIRNIILYFCLLGLVNVILYFCNLGLGRPNAISILRKTEQIRYSEKMVFDLE